MHAWLVELQQPTLGDPAYRPYRMGMLADALVTRGHRVTRWISDYSHQSHAYRFGRSGRQTLRPGDEAFALHTKITYERAVSGRRLLNNIQLGRLFRKHAANEEAPDVIVCSVPTPNMAAASAEIASQRGIPFVLDTRDLWPDMLFDELRGAKGIAGKFAAWWMHRDLKYAAQRADAMVGITDPFRDFLFRYVDRSPGEFDRVFPLGFNPRSVSIDEETRKQERAAWESRGVNLHSPGRVICFAGRLNRTVLNAFAPVVDAAATLRRTHPELQFVVCGSGGCENEIKQMAAGEPNIVLPGEVSPQALSALRPATLASLLCVERRHDYQHSLSNKFFEYLSAGVPVLCSLDGLPGQTLNAERCGFVYDNGTGLSESIQKLLDDPALAGDMGARARHLFETRFTADKVYGSFTDLLEEIDAIKKPSTEGEPSSGLTGAPRTSQPSA